MDLNAYKKIAPEINAAIEAALKKHGFKINKLNSSIDPHAGFLSISIKAVDTNLTDASGNATTSEAEFYKQNCHNVYPACDVRWLGAEFQNGRKTFKLVGMRNTRSEKCLIATGEDGQRYVYTPQGIAQAFALKEKLASLQKKSA